MSKHTPRGFHVCRHESTLDIRGKQRTYEAIKARILEAGGFTVFDATANARDAWKFDALSLDPELHIIQAGFPWYRVEKREKTEAQS